ncbi:MAG: lipid IV(A) 4-amino-4-deoxy-L-arabinosyltransferase [Proteus vulgaris]|uniref:lipid IV(A) 4-amino-4-deoxy-L-arabinosyltransferase n=1 Tax=Proteus TaxID=583 RepID=UPI000C9F672A|nr:MULTISPECIES: lipid IV(A) 4-amino-4-deoxy-L-arabinosyltransferase [Proteus]AYY79702.1 lipid IV(A) 4-amino-4-deoxy-L-arabinosyltransferase [Proteus vulgaris]MBI6510619.1 lipid IV(A) 4-amino-4-deoxy-L-arabinosyltransferase [Proteus sp. PR00174]NBN74226.1 lipid IV(A) 4-amino-4-deoxy-L-arabinosyltransferase [Proteus sp. G2615]UBH62704.1 lipid IV(A) 4-amino-4-deoxy-L-arabinosyltransferase [Proteus vulgaris]UWT99513.1 lipid IV(A) 4-amino-4-deoxy-L-arabinosyltransferase [Proteus vulgaris]
MSVNFVERYKWFLLFIFILLTYFIPLETRLLWQPDEIRYAEISREMLASGNWSVPYLLDIRYFEKPVLGYWLNSVAQWLFGSGHFSVRFVVVTSTLLTGLFVYRVALLVWHNQALAFNALVVFLSSFLVLSIGTYNILDPIVTMFVTVAMYYFLSGLLATDKKSKIYTSVLVGIFCGLGFLTKGFIAVVLPALVFVVTAISLSRFKEVLCYAPIAFMAMLFIAAPWVISVALQAPDYWHYFFWIEHVQRFIAKGSARSQPIWFYLPIVILGILPWLGFLFGALKSALFLKKGTLYFSFWLFLFFTFFSASSGKLLTYMLPCFVPLSILIASYMEELKSKSNEKIHTLNAIINTVFGVIGVSIIIYSLYSSRFTLYEADEQYKALLAIGGFLVWSMMGIISFFKSTRLLTLFCSIGLSLVIGYAIPHKIESKNTPEKVINDYYSELVDKPYILTDEVGIGTSLAWGLKRTDIRLTETKGELAYGLAYPDVQNKYYDIKQLVNLIEENNYQGIAIVLVRPERKEILSVISQLKVKPTVEKQDDLTFVFFN